LGDRFHKAHGEILQLTDKDMTDEYFTTKHYEKISNSFIEYLKTLERKARELEDDGAATNKGDSTADDKAKMRKLLRNQRALMQVIKDSVEDVMSKAETTQPPSYYPITAAVLENHMIEFTTNNGALWDLTDQDSIEEYTLKTFYEIEQSVKRAMIQLQEHMPKDANHQPNQSISSSTETSLKLPKISIPKFNGDYLQWDSFKDLYTELVHNAPISDSQRMHYLTQALTDEPKGLIKHLPSTGSNYNAAWTILISRYDNKRLIVSALLNQLLSQQQTKSESPATIKSLHDVTKECIHGLKAQGLPVQHWDAMIAHIVIRRMDQATQTLFEQGIDNNKRLLTQDEVLKFLERRFQSLEVRGINDKSHKRGGGSKGESTRTCASATKSDSNANCPVCKGQPHKLYACKTFADAELSEKWKWVKNLKLCANCLQSGHQAEACKLRHCKKCPKNTTL